ncbi:MAG: zinc ribbon domain-containing protein [Methanomassiliicoccales archaeon]|nr:zinc ribbon domain-containing protein [Methanomassiliicoccales archaeon]
MKKCVKCFAETDEGAQICRRCGSKKFFIEKESVVTCTQCGATNPKGSTDCYSCGVHL